MVSLVEVQESNARISSSFPDGLVAVFVGGTSGIGEMALKQFAKHTRRPRAYFLGRSQEAGDRITSECKTLNSKGEFIFIKADLSLIRTVDDVCRDIQSKEKAINLLFLTIGTGVLYKETPEGLHLITALNLYARVRFIINLLPLIQNAHDLRRVVTVGGGSKEGKIDMNDFQGRGLPVLSLRPHLTSMVTLALKFISRKTPNVAFIHEYPGTVKTNLWRDVPDAKIDFSGAVPEEESGQRQLYFATSGRYPPSSGEVVQLIKDGVVARGISGTSGSGVYSVGWDGESASMEVEELLAKYKEDGTMEKVWNHISGEFERITRDY